MTTLAELRDSVNLLIYGKKTSNYEVAFTDLTIKYALDHFCSHTALVKSTDVEAGQTVYDLPSDLYSDLEVTGLIYYIHNEKMTLVNPVRNSKKLKPDSLYGYYIANEKINISKIPTFVDETTILRIDYYAFYTIPDDENENIPVPRWAVPAIIYLAGYHTMSPQILAEASIKKWAEKTDAFTAEMSSSIVTARHYLNQYELLISKYRKQDRTQMFRGL